MHDVVNTVTDRPDVDRNGAHRRARRADLCQDLSRMVREHLAGRRHARGSMATVDQLRTQLALECGDVGAHPRLRAMDLGGRGGEPTAVDDREIGLQPVQLHARHRRRGWPGSPQGTTLGKEAAYPRIG